MADIKTAPASKQRFGLVAWLLLLIVISAMGAIGYGSWLQLQKWTGQLSDQTSVLQAKLAQQEAQLNQLSQTLFSLKEIQDHTAENSQLAQQQLQQLQEQWSGFSATDQTEMLLTEAEYLVRLANQRVNLMQDPSGAMAFLKAADQIIVKLDDPATLTIRQALADEIVALENTAAVDIVGLSLRIEEYSQTINQLNPIPTIPVFKTEAPPAQPLLHRDSSWQETLANLLTKLIQAITPRIKSYDDNVKALVLPEHRLYVRQNLLLVLEQARLALLMGEPAIYQQALLKAQMLLNEYFPLQDQVKALLTGLQQLAQTQVKTDLPDISLSLTAIRHYRDRVAQRNQALGST